MFSATQAHAAAITFTIATSENVIVTGTPQIAIKVGSADRYASFSGAQNQALQALPFTYAVQPGDFDPDGNSIDTPEINLKGGTITDLAGNSLGSLTSSKPNTSALKVQTYTLSNRNFLRFLAASSTYLELASSPLTGLSSMHLSAVAMYPSNQGWARLFDFGASKSVYMVSPLGWGGRFRLTNSTWTGEQGPVPATAWWTDNQPFVAGFEHTGAAMTIWRNGTSVQTAAGVTLAPSAAAGTLNYIGRSQFAAPPESDPYPNMNVIEFIVLSAANTASSQSLQSSQSSYYGITF